jgi:hypothetical protein
VGRIEMSGVFKFTPEEKSEIIILCLSSPDKLSERYREMGVAPVNNNKCKQRYISGGLGTMSRAGVDSGIREVIISGIGIELHIDSLLFPASGISSPPRNFIPISVINSSAFAHIFFLVSGQMDDKFLDAVFLPGLKAFSPKSR